MGECENCGDWCRSPYKYCWRCNQEEVVHECEECGATFYGERWKNICKSCYFDSINGVKRKNKAGNSSQRNEYGYSGKQTKLIDF